MERFRTICFALISLVLLSACKSTSFSFDSATPVQLVSFSASEPVKFQATILFRNIQLSGIVVMKAKGDSITGAFVNEFGLKGFEFIVAGGKCRCFNMMSKLNKWYIRQTLENDLLFMFSSYPDRKELIQGGLKLQLQSERMHLKKLDVYSGHTLINQLQVTGDDTFEMVNLRRGLKYSYKLLK